MVKIFDGGFFAGAFALIPVTFFSCAYGSIYLYDTFDFLFWNIMIFLLVKLFFSKNKNYWIYIGIAAGLALLTKITILFLGAGIVVSLLLTKERKYFVCWKLWIAGIIALLIFSPYIIWNFNNGFPTLEFFKDYASGKLIHMSTLFYIKTAIVSTLPFSPIWFLGLFYFLFNSKGKKYRVIGLTFIVIFILCILKHTRTNLINAYYPVLLAGGGVLLEYLLRNKKMIWVKIAYIIFMICMIFYGLPNVRPVLPLNAFIKYYGNEGKR